MVILMAKGLVALACVMDIYRRKISSGVLSSTVDAGFCG